MREFGANQAAFGIEPVIDMLAEKVGIDGWEIRWRNALEVGDMFAMGRASVGLKKTLLAVKDVYRNAKFAGIGCGIKNVGIGNGGEDAGRAIITVEADGAVVVLMGFTEMGQGLFTVQLQTFCEETGINPRLCGWSRIRGMRWIARRRRARAGRCSGARRCARRARSSNPIWKKSAATARSPGTI